MSILYQEFGCATTMHEDEDATMKSRPGIGLNHLIAAADRLEIHHSSLSLPQFMFL